ncbi:cytochrome P450 [Actinosynnema sp. NPDC020468]|uniref:cytochrome P450 n=1 Tax=Actinosynnema sp. NPDC020468 TaxID=3154488 RepID=UPI0033C5E3A7
MGVGDRRRFRDDPQGYLGELRRARPAGVIPLPWGGWCVGDADLAHRLLRDREFNSDRSGFFGELLPTRAAQVEVGRAVRDFLRARLPDYRAALAAAVAEFPEVTRWPDAATSLVHRCLRDLLLHPATPDATRRSADRAVHGGVVFRAPRAWQRARGEVVRARLLSAVGGEVARRRGHSGEPRDVLDVVSRAVLDACPEHAGERVVAEVHLTMFRSIVAPVASSLAWAVLLACLHHPEGTRWPWPVADVVREAMRHRPMVWMVGRTVPRPTEFGGTAFRPGDLLSVSPYLLHHDERHWADAEEFRPERWASPGGRGPYIPYGAGPFTCPGASVADVLITDALTALVTGARLTVSGGDARAVMVEGAVPRHFALRRLPEPDGTSPRGGGEP